MMVPAFGGGNITNPWVLPSIEGREGLNAAEGSRILAPGGGLRQMAHPRGSLVFSLLWLVGSRFGLFGRAGGQETDTI